MQLTVQESHGLWGKLFKTRCSGFNISQTFARGQKFKEIVCWLGCTSRNGRGFSVAANIVNGLVTN